ncbi:MAG: rhodanese-related sulfurtransferase [Parvibaculales bacterium]
MDTGAVPPVPPHGANTPFVVAALYKFVALPDFADLQPRLKLACKKAGISGTILLAHEGINGTVAGDHAGISNLMAFLRNHPALGDLEAKFSFAAAAPFNRMKVRLKKEIVTLGQPAVDPTNTVGTYVAPEDWNALIEDPDTLVIDTRNDYEVAIGTFENAVNPETETFRDFAAYVRDKLKPLVAGQKPKNIAMFCTGGIRCEKSTSYLLQEGFENVFHLKGGILKYLEHVPEQDSKWHGQCFVFDQRVSVGHGLVQGDYDMCHACRMPITQEDKQDAHFQPGISCPKCHGTHSESQLKRFSDRQKQVELAKARGETHIGAMDVDILQEGET